jgi:acyl-CoA reductase-like NAD-dependent aldehyde dehydrogenase
MAIGARVYQNHINGEWRAASSGEQHANLNPARPDEIIGYFPRSTADDARAAIAAAVAARDGWAATSQLRRGEFLLRASELLTARLDEVATAMTREEGKTLREARGETMRGVALLRYFGGEGSQPIGEVYPSANTRTMLYTMHVPLGVVAAITPWNFPVAIPLWKVAPALVYGNTVVLKPAELTPLTATLLVEILAEAGLPPGVLNLVVGSGSTVGPVLSESPEVTGISFTGSNVVGRALQRIVQDRGGKIQLELGGKNPVIVLEDADLDQAAMLTVNGAMLSTGQKCTATSRAIVVRSVLDAFTKKVLARVEAMVVGDGLDERTNMGPCVSAAQRDTVLQYFQIAREEGATLLAGGSALDSAQYHGGYFVQPTVYANVRPDMRIAQEEIFGPVLGIIPADDAEQALAIANGVRFGLSASIFTRDIASSFRFTRQIQAGIIHVNGETAGAEPQVPFGGMKESSSFSREQGKASVHFFTQTKTVYFDEPATPA